MAIGNLQVGIALPYTAGQALNAKVGQGAMLGFYASVAGTASIYDSASTTTATPLGTALVINTGWNPFPVTFSAGLYVVLTTAAGTLVYV